MNWKDNIIETSEQIKALLTNTKRIAVVGIKTEEQSYQPAFYVPQYMQNAGFEIIPVPVYYPEVETILNAMKEYGMFVADNGIDWAISVAPDPRIPNLHEELRKIKGENFEVVTPPPSYKKPR